MHETDYWNALRNAWNTSSLEIPSTPVTLAVAEEDVWATLVQAADGAVPGLSSTTYLQGVGVAEDLPWILPSPADDSLDDYLDRVEGRASGREWSCAFSGLHRVSAAMWDRAASTAAQLEDRLDARPVGRTDVDVFMGRYTATRVGIHQDFAHNLSYTLRGPKRLITWGPELEPLLPVHSTSYQHVLDQAVVLNGRPDGFTYFPPEQFHIGESPDAATAAVNIVFFEVANDPVEEALLPVRSVLGQARAHSRLPSAGDGSTIDPHAVSEVYRAIEQGIDAGTFQRIATSRWLRSITSFRLESSRPYAKTRSDMPDRIRLRTGARLVHVPDPSDSDVLLFSCDGNVSSCPRSPEVVELLERLNNGESVSSQAVTAGPALESLHAWGGAEAGA